MNEQLLQRLTRALRLDRAAFEEFRDDASFTPVGAGVAAVAILLAGLGAWLWGEITAANTPDGFFLDTVVLGTIFTFLLWLAWMAVTYVVLTQVFGETLAPDALFRVFAVAAVPFGLGLLVFIPELNFWLALSSIAVMLYLTVFGLQAAFAIDQMRVMAAVAAGFAVFAIVLSLLITVNNSFATGAFVFEVSEDAVTKSYSIPDYDSQGITTPD